MVDSNDRERLDESKAAFDKMIQNDNLRGVPLLLAANKQDLSDCMGVREVKPMFEKVGEALRGREVMVLATSGLRGDGVEDGIDWVAGAVRRNTAVRPPQDNDSG